MNLRIAASATEFNIRVERLKNALNSNKLIDENLEITTNKGINRLYFCILTLLQPFYWIVGRDAFSHVRAHRVARRIFEFCKINKQFLENNPDKIIQIKKNLIQRLQNKQKITRSLTNREKEYASQNSVSHLIDTVSKISKTVEIVQERVTKRTLRYHIPNNLEELRIPSTQRQEIIEVTNQFRNYDVATFDKRTTGQKNTPERSVTKTIKFYHINPWTNVKTFRKEMMVTNSFFFTQDHKILLICKKILGQGANKKARVCLNLNNGKKLVRKKLTDKEKKLFELFKKNNIEGTTKAQYIRHTDFNEKTQIIQDCYDGTLQDLGETLSNEERITVALKLTKTLKDLHTLRTDDCKFAHKDIKPNNIFLKREDGELKVVIGDFDGSCYMMKCGTIGYQSPEKIRAYNKYNGYLYRSSLRRRGPFYGIPFRVANNAPTSYREMAASQIENFDKNLAQKSDVWALGLVILYSITARANPQQQLQNFFKVFPYFPTYNNYLLNPVPQQRATETWISPSENTLLAHARNIQTEADTRLLELTQEQINQDIETLKQRFPNQDELFNIVAKMLKVDPETRITAQQAHRDLEQYDRTREQAPAQIA